MYRENVAPPVETLHTLTVRPSKGAKLVALAFALALVAGVTFVVLAVGSQPQDDTRTAQIISAIATLVLGGAAMAVHLRRARSLRVVRTGDVIRVLVERDGVELTGPIECSGMQMETRVGRLPSYEVWLMLVDARGRGVSLHEARGAAYGPEKDWFTTVTPCAEAVAYEVGGAGTLARLRARLAE